MALYNKHRPKTFEDMIGNHKTIKMLSKHFCQPYHNHTILFTGPTGTGKTTAGRITGRNLLRLAPDDSLRHQLNYYEVNAGLEGNKDTVSRIAKMYNYRPIGASEDLPYVHFLDECSFLTKQAQSALYKLMEDIPGYCYLIFSTMEPEKLSKAFKDRCATFNFEPPNEYELMQLLDTTARKEGRIVGYDVLQKITASECCVREAIGKLEAIMTLSAIEQLDIIQNNFVS